MRRLLEISSCSGMEKETDLVKEVEVDGIILLEVVVVALVVRRRVSSW